MNQRNITPCPACKKGRPVQKRNQTPSKWIECDTCGFMIGPWLSTWNEVAELVNTRSTPADALAGELRAHFPQGQEIGANLSANMFRRILASLQPAPAPFQERVSGWMLECFTPEIAADKLERADRFCEEALELVQTTDGFSAERAHALVDYVFSRPKGDPVQEVGGVMVTLAALCGPNGLDMTEAGEAEYERINKPEVIEKIRTKQASKPTGSALPIAAPAPETAELRERKP